MSQNNSPTAQDSNTPTDEDEPLYKDEAWLREKYDEEFLTQSEIADLCGTGSTTIATWMEKFEIESRKHSNRALLETQKRLYHANRGTDEDE